MTACTGSVEGGSAATIGSFEEAAAPPIDANAEIGTIKYLTYETNFVNDSTNWIQSCCKKEPVG